MMDAGSTTAVKPRLGFVGVGWIGLSRMKAILEEDCGVAAVLTDPNRDALQGALEAAPSAALCGDLDELLGSDVDGVVLATPSGMHAEQAVRALDAGKAVFCQKPLGRTAPETEAVIDAARRNDRLLGVDLSYRYTRAMQSVRSALRAGELGRIYAANLVFHNAYGPDKAWAQDPELAGGGCVIDLGIHLVDLLLWSLDGSEIRRVGSTLFRKGRRLALPTQEIEDYAHAEIELSDGGAAHLACSWRFSCGCDAVIEASFYGTDGSLCFRNVEGSFYDFTAELRRGARTDVLVSPPDGWSGRAAVEWASRLAEDAGYDPGIEDGVDLARAIDMMYGR
jgi:predicted dehydrogenase